MNFKPVIINTSFNKAVACDLRRGMASKGLPMLEILTSTVSQKYFSVLNLWNIGFSLPTQDPYVYRYFPYKLPQKPCQRKE